MISKSVDEYPILQTKWWRSLSPHMVRLKALVGDFDGDTCSFNTVYTDDSINEIDSKLDDVGFYLYPDNTVIDSNSNDFVDLVIKHITE